MHDSAMRDHLTIVAMLPDFVLGKLDETSLHRVARHLEACSVCRDECANAMDVLGSLAAVPPPPVCLRGAVMQRAAAATPAAIRLSNTGMDAPKRRDPSAGIALRPPEGDRQHAMPFGKPLPRWAFVAASAAVFLVSGMAVWNFEQRQTVMPQDRIQALMSDPAAGYPLESDLGLMAKGVVFAEPQGREAYLVANGLPVLPRDQRYQVWLFTTQDELVTAGLLIAGADGEVRALLETPDPFANYVGVALTAEPVGGSLAPTSDEVLGGSLPSLSASVPGLPAQIMPSALDE